MSLPADFHALYDAESSALAAPAGEAEAATMLAAPAGGRLAAGAAEAVADHADEWGLTPEDLATVTAGKVSGGGALRTVRLTQQVGGVEVFNSDVTVALDADDAAVALSGRLFGGAAAAASSTALAEAAPVAAEAAIAFAASDVTGAQYAADEFAATESAADAGPYRFYRHDGSAADGRPAFARDVRVKDVLFPLGGERFAPGLYVELWSRGLPGFNYVVATDGEPRVLFRSNLSRDVAFKYRVYATGDPLARPLDSPAPGTPHPTGNPDGFQAPVAAARELEIDSLLGDPWLPPDATTTAGNNCIAYADLRFPDGQGAGDVIGRVTASRKFGAAYDHARPATDPTNLQASLAGMFYVVNWVHDRWHDAGFDEAAGNGQQDNFGRGGIGGDRILAEGNDFSGTENANMQTPPDGSSPIMQMYVFPGPEPDRTSNLEALIVIHELGHYLSQRLIGDGQGGLDNRQGRAMGEGWGDLLALVMTSRGSDDFQQGTFGMGGWALRSLILPGFDDNYYYGIRRYPHSARMDRMPLTLRHIADGEPLPPGVPFSDGRPDWGPNNQVHNAGEVWCAALWEVFVNLVARHDHLEAERRMLRYVIGGLKLTPIRPTYVQARDAIIAAIGASDRFDLEPAWRGFAKRGLGDGAVAPPSGSLDLRGVTESFALPAGLVDESGVPPLHELELLL
jgi:extracellular elastinolytic metalloproteinase